MPNVRSVHPALAIAFLLLSGCDNEGASPSIFDFPAAFVVVGGGGSVAVLDLAGGD